MCTKSFTTTGELKLHMNYHNGKFNYLFQYVKKTLTHLIKMAKKYYKKKKKWLVEFVFKQDKIVWGGRATLSHFE